MRGLVLAGTASGIGKTVATLAAIRAFENADRTVQPAKAGPDFIDPSHHARVAGRPSRTLDPWLQGDDGLRRNYARGDGDLCVVEGMMGLYDGNAASTAGVAAGLDLPVVLVVDASAGMESVAATALGFAEYADRTPHDLNVVGVVAQRAHGGRHEAGIREALPNSIAYCGRVPPHQGLEIPDRHLGLQMGEEAPLDDAALDAAAETLRTDRLLDIAREPTLPVTDPDAGAAGGDDGRNRGDRGDSPRIAVADDAAFRFIYPATRELLAERATVVPFAPTTGDDLPPCDGVYLPGGYPELHAAALADGPALGSIADAASEGTPVLGECGGLMALAETLTTADGDAHEMAGVLPASVERRERYQALNHVELRARRGALTADAGARLRGHEFHYSAADVASDARFAFDVERGTGIDGDREGLTEHRTLGTYCHVHPESGAFDAFLDEVEG
ncbi:cobyrinic acid a,c-diamide synthase [Halorubrum sp. RMP-47]|uniref:Cobyrinic acid a,c-diamide synthase n=1 Tax=Halorubrum miltondacostae TaxID=3076378 RepID=A0ABD5M556_9EURY